MCKGRKLVLILIFLLTIPFFTLSISFIAATNTSTVYGYIKDKKGNPIEGCVITAFISGMQEGQNTTNEDGYYEIDLGLLMSTTYVSLHSEPENNFKNKVTGTTIYSGQDKLKNITLEQFFALVIGGASENRFTIDANGMYQVLKDHYSFTDDNIWLLTYDSVTGRDRQVSKSNILWAIGVIASKSTSIDHVYIWITSHGYYDEFQTGYDLQQKILAQQILM
ncbi:MAG: carboxypeptidase regulatory-like domain-containing protein [Candidatus Heimdallarchaeota archaeon]|nr:carboxypeptidase regulatory-like domain-containing protein [Candidatus Heimdallarchaeota archaeon]